jgi:hypothetical protein
MRDAVIIRGKHGICVVLWAELVECLRRDDLDWLVNACNAEAAVAVWPLPGSENQILLQTYITSLYDIKPDDPLFYRCADQSFFIPSDYKIIAFISF